VTRSTFELIAEGDAPLERRSSCAECLGSRADVYDAEFVLNSLPPGQYGIVILDVSNKLRRTMVLIRRRLFCSRRMETGNWADFR